MKKILLIVTLSMLSGCLWQETSIVDIRAAEKICTEHGGIYSIVVYATSVESVECMNGYSQYIEYNSHS